MRKQVLNIILALTVAASVIFPSCTPGSCFEETNAFVKATFYNDTTGKVDSPDSLSLYGIDRDTSLIYNKTTGVNQALIPLDASAGGCGFVIRINGVNDTLSFTYSTYNHLISKECGYTFYHTIDPPSYTKNIIDTVTVIKNTITILSEENIRIYY